MATTQTENETTDQCLQWVDLEEEERIRKEEEEAQLAEARAKSGSRQGGRGSAGGEEGDKVWELGSFRKKSKLNDRRFSRVHSKIDTGIRPKASSSVPSSQNNPGAASLQQSTIALMDPTGASAQV